MALIEVLRGFKDVLYSLVIAIFGVFFLLVITIVIIFVVILAITFLISAIILFLAITGNLATFTPWDQFLPSKDIDLMAVFFHYLNLVIAGFIYWFDIVFIGAFIFCKSVNPGRNIFILGLGILIFLLIRSFFI